MENSTKVMKRKFFAIKNMKNFPSNRYVGNLMKQFDLIHPTACVNQFISDDMEEIPNILKLCSFLD